ncbi:hypothetical protein ACETRX_31740, partial [Labrys portucalensis]
SGRCKAGAAVPIDVELKPVSSFTRSCLSVRHRPEAGQDRGPQGRLSSASPAWARDAGVSRLFMDAHMLADRRSAATTQPPNTGIRSMLWVEPVDFYYGYSECFIGKGFNFA